MKFLCRVLHNYPILIVLLEVIDKRVCLLSVINLTDTQTPLLPDSLHLKLVKTLFTPPVLIGASFASSARNVPTSEY